MGPMRLGQPGQPGQPEPPGQPELPEQPELPTDESSVAAAAMTILGPPPCLLREQVTGGQVHRG